MVETTFLSREPVQNGTNFIGRQTEIAWFQDKLGWHTPQNCNLIGQPRIGKTSLLNHLYQNKVGLNPGITGLYVWVRLLELSTANGTAFWRLMLDRLQSEQKKAGLPFVDEPAPDADDAAALFERLEAEVEHLLAHTNQPQIIFLIDDFDVLRNTLQDRDLDWLRAFVTRYDQTLGLVISSIRPLTEITTDIQAESPLTNVFHDLWLGLLSRAAAVDLCQQAAAAEGQGKLDEDVLAFLLAEAGRHPALLKLACTSLFTAWRNTSGPEAFEDVKGDLRFDASVRSLCQRLYEPRRPDAQLLLLNLARDNYEIKDPIIFNRLKRHLGLVEMRDGVPSLFSNTFRYWLKDTILQEQAVLTPKKPILNNRSEQQTGHPTLHHNAGNRQVIVGDREIRLTPLQNRLMKYMMEHKGEVCTTQALLENAWGPGRTSAVVEKAINRLREKIEPAPKRPRYILSARGEGYMLNPY